MSFNCDACNNTELKELVLCENCEEVDCGCEEVECSECGETLCPNCSYNSEFWVNPETDKQQCGGCRDAWGSKVRMILFINEDNKGQKFDENSICKYEDEFFFNTEGNVCMVWQAQNKITSKDNDIKDPNTIIEVFSRSKNTVPYVYRGIVNRKVVFKERSEITPLTMIFTTGGSSGNIDIGTKSKKIENLNGKNCWKQDCFDMLNLTPTKKNYNEGVMYAQYDY